MPQNGTINSAWKTDNYTFVGKAFDFTYKNNLNKLMPIMSEVMAKSVDYELTGSGGYGEVPAYDGENLNMAQLHRGFKTIITPQEYTLSMAVDYKAAKIDKFGETARVGTKLGQSMSGTVWLHAMRMFANAWNPDCKGGDGKSWAASDHPVASKGSSGRTFIADTEAGTYSNVTTDQLSVSAITDLQSRANRMLTPDGLPLMCELDTILIPPELEEKAKRMFGTDAKLLPGTDYNDANPVYGMKYIVLGAGNDGFKAKQWAACNRAMMKELVKIVYNTKPTVFPSQSMDSNPLKDIYTTYADFGTGWGDARMIFFSNPS